MHSHAKVQEKEEGEQILGEQKMEERKIRRAHCLVVPYSTQGHINPMLQFGKRLAHKGVKVTLVITRFLARTITHIASSSSIGFETISDGRDEGGRNRAESLEAYLDSFRKSGSRTLAELIEKLKGSDSPVDCIIYDPFVYWCLDVAKKFELVGAAFFTQSCAVDSIYYYMFRGRIELPLKEAEISLPGLPPLAPGDLPSFLYDFGSNPSALDMLLGQFSNIGQADWVLCSTFYELEQQVVDCLAKTWPLRTIGPTIPSMYLDKQLKDDADYGCSIFKPNNDACINWLNERPKGSVVYVSFGSLAALSVEQMEELSWGLKRISYYFLWVVRASEQAKLPKGYAEETREKGLVVSWCSQLEVLAHKSVGCFVTHCGWNSTLEALSLGVPMVAMPQWTDQATNAKYIEDVWEVGLRTSLDEKGIVRQESVEHCIREIMEGVKGREININAQKWSKLAREAMIESGSSDKNINEFAASLLHR